MADGCPPCPDCAEPLSSNVGYLRDGSPYIASYNCPECELTLSWKEAHDYD